MTEKIITGAQLKVGDSIPFGDTYYPVKLIKPLHGGTDLYVELVAHSTSSPIRMYIYPHQVITIKPAQTNPGNLTKAVLARGMTYFDLTEFDADWVNAATRKDINDYAKTHPETWLGKINRYDDDAGTPYMVKYTGQKVYNFEYEFAVPAPDAILIKLLMDHDNEVSSKDTMSNINKIDDRIDKLGGIILFWK